MRRLSADQALEAHRANAQGFWNRAPSSSERSERPTDAANRIWDDYATIVVPAAQRRLTAEDGVYAMGSCFAREVERQLARLGANVVSMNQSVDRPEFQDSNGRLVVGFFNRFNPRAMLQEFQRAFDELPGWKEDSLLLAQRNGEVADLNYWPMRQLDKSPTAALTRRSLAREVVRQVSKARLVILTLGLIEAWRHRPSGLYLNGFSPNIVSRNPDDFELHLLDYEDTLQCLDGILDLIRRRIETPGVQLVITVSPVPMQATFTDADIVVANASSKSVLRAAAMAFAERNEEVAYFPSYEIVSYSSPQLAWMPDRVHVEHNMVTRVVDCFTDAFYEPGALWESPDVSKAPRWSNPGSIRRPETQAPGD